MDFPPTTVEIVSKISFFVANPQVYPQPKDRRIPRMTQDLVSALRDYNRHDTDELMDKAADEIVRLRAELEDAQRQADVDSAHMRSDKAEIDRLRAELAAANKFMDKDAEDYNVLKEERDSLRSENTEMRNAIKKACQEYQRRWYNLEIPAECHSHLEAILGPLRDILAKTAKEDTQNV